MTPEQVTTQLMNNRVCGRYILSFHTLNFYEFYIAYDPRKIDDLHRQRSKPHAEPVLA